MSKNIVTRFPQKHLNKMIGASRAMPGGHGLRLDSATPRQMRLLYNFVHRDAAPSLWFARQLEYVRPGLLEVLYPNLEGKSMVPLETAVPAGAEQWTYRAYDKVGVAQLVHSYAMDPPRADVEGIEQTQLIRPYGSMYGYNFHELRAGMMANIPLDVRKAMAARYAMELKIDQIIFYGDVAGGLKGLTTLANTQTFTIANGAKGTKLWRDKTADEIVLDMHSLVNNIVTASFGVYQPSDLLLPLKAYAIAATRRMGDGSNQTCLEFFKATTPYIKNVRATYRLDYSQSGNWSGSAGRMVAYEKSPERLAFVLPVEFEQLPPQQIGYEYKTLCHSRCGGLVAMHPASVSFGDGITDASD